MLVAFLEERNGGDGAFRISEGDGSNGVCGMGDSVDGWERRHREWLLDLLREGERMR